MTENTNHEPLPCPEETQGLEKGKDPSKTVQWPKGTGALETGLGRREDSPHTLSTCWVHKLLGLKRGHQMVLAKQDICHLSVERRVRVTLLSRCADTEGHLGQGSW